MKVRVSEAKRLSEHALFLGENVVRVLHLCYTG